MANWKIVTELVDSAKIEYTPFLQGRKFFAVDDSGSTAGGILRRERAFVDAFQASHRNPADTISLWGSNCDEPTAHFNTIPWLSRHGGTVPSSILNQQGSLDAIKESDVWFLLTDGEIWGADVHRLADLALEAGVLNVPLVFLITGSPGHTPGTANISVGISFFASAQDTLILFKERETGMIYVIAGKGCFAALGGTAGAQDLESWDDLPLFPNELALFDHFKQLEVYVTKAEHRPGSGKGISLGPEWDERMGKSVRVDLDLLLTTGSLPDSDIFALLAGEAFYTLAVAYKTRSRVAELRAFLQKQKIEQIAPKLEDVADAALIIAKMGNTMTTDVERRILQEQLRVAHVKNREHYQKSSTEFTGSQHMQDLKKRNHLIDAALQTLASVEAAGYNADILSRKSNRARRAEVVDSVAAINITKLDLNAPACKGFCLVCCGEEEVMSICFKQPELNKTEDNTTDFALNFPLAAGASSKNVDLVSSQNICFQCALMAPEGKSIYNEDMIAIVPALHYNGGNKKYINDQLYLALTAGLTTGAAGISQLFMAILQGLLQTKAWAGAGLNDAEPCADEYHEGLQRRRTFLWMLAQLMQNTLTREDFKETGNWVQYPQALMWAAEDFEAHGLASFAVTYPAAGFNNLLALGMRANAFSEDRIRRMKSAKAVHSVAAKYLADLQPALQKGGSDEQWKQKYLEIIYQDFNGPLVPKDQGADSLVTNIDICEQRLAACIGRTTFEDASAVICKVQLILFWLLFKQKGHCTAQTFFSRLRETEPLATAVLDPRLTVPEIESRNILLSIFAIQDAQLINAEALKMHSGLVPFANPFGASVLHCGAEGCSEIFCRLTSSDEINGKTVNTIRGARAQHLINVFGIVSRFESSLTGLPERANAGHPPTSVHSNLHISIVREWAAHTVEQRRLVMADEAAREEFVKNVRCRLCVEGRGNIFQHDLDHDTKVLLPSFFGIIKKALEKDGRKEVDVAEYQHDFGKNRMEEKVRWEMEAAKRTVVAGQNRVERSRDEGGWELL